MGSMVKVKRLLVILLVLMVLSALLNITGCTDQPTGTDTSPPEDVGDLQALPGDTLVNLSWGASSDSQEDLKGYKVYFKTESGDYGGGIDIGKGTRKRVAGLTNGVSYIFKVTAYDESGNESSGLESDPVTPGDTTPPEDVTNFKAVAAILCSP